MRSLKTLVLAGAVFAGATAVASAADLGPPPVHGGLPPAPYAAPIAEASGWYLRGDIGVASQSYKPKLEDSRFFNPLVVDTFNRNLSKNVVNGGVGVGYQFNSWFRADLTAEHRMNQKFRFEDGSCYGTNGGVFFGSPGVANCTPAQLASTTATYNRNYYNGRVSTNLFLSNGYLDLGNWSGFTPFVGAGAGFAQHNFNKVSDVGIAQNYALGVPVGTTTSGTVNFRNSSQINFAWALMAGVAYDVSQNAKLELGYRYLNMGNGKQYVNCATPTAINTCGDFLRYNKMQSHEVRVGLRWMLGGAGYAPIPVAAAPMPYPAEAPRVIKKF